MKMRLVTRRAKWGATLAAVSLIGILGAGAAFAATPNPPTSPPNPTSPPAGAAMTPAQAETMMDGMANSLRPQDRGRFQAMEAGMLQMMHDAHMFNGTAGNAAASMMGGRKRSAIMGPGTMMGGGSGR